MTDDEIMKATVMAYDAGYEAGLKDAAFLLFPASGEEYHAWIVERIKTVRAATYVSVSEETK